MGPVGPSFIRPFTQYSLMADTYIVNITADQLATLQEPKGVVDQILSSPFFWLFMAVAVIALVFYMLRKQKPGDPSTKPWYGREQRKELMQKEMKKRFNNFGGSKVHVHLEKGAQRVGIITQIEHDKMLFSQYVIDAKTKKKVIKPTFYYRVDRFRYRHYGIWARIMSWFGFGYNYMCITPDAYRAYRPAKEAMNNTNPLGKMIKPAQLRFIIDPQVHLLNDSDVWTLADEKAINANLEYIMKAHHENIHGYETDFLRRLSVHASTQAINLEKMSHEARLKEEERKARTQGYT